MVDPFDCPFCAFTTDTEYDITSHVEQHHMGSLPRRDASPATPDAAAMSQPIEEDWITCPRHGCGEVFLISDIEEHVAVHESVDASEIEDIDFDQTHSNDTERNVGPGQPQHRRPSPAADRTRNMDTPRKLEKKPPERLPPRRSPTIPARTHSMNGTLDRLFRGTSIVGNRRPATSPPPPRSGHKLEPGRLGKRELGPHAFESHMPDRVRRQLIHDALPRTRNVIARDGRLEREHYIENETAGVIDVLADLSSLDRDVKRAYFCRRSVRHIRRIQCEGNFCGYWNIQMLLSALQRQQGSRLRQLLPNVLQIQDDIEAAWANGMCTYSRVETGGVRGTRKWIGSMEAAAYLMHNGIDVTGQTFQSTEGGRDAYEKLLDHVEAYFMSAAETASVHGTSTITDLAPIYLQRQGHSITIVGLQRWVDGYRDLLVFDPSIETSKTMRHLLDGHRVRASPETLVKPYRRSERHLSLWREFEIVQVDPQAG